MKVNDGKYFENLVKLLEKAIDPDSIVEHDVEIPILNSHKGATTQCDIVIRTGKKPRETITIVEVQDRTSKIKPNDFRGWIHKLSIIGAQHLICVSRQKFPESIKEQASLSGNVIRLITLAEMTDDIPMSLMKSKFKIFHFNVLKIENLQPILSEFELLKFGLSENDILKEFTIFDNIFSVDKSKMISLYFLCNQFVKEKELINSGSEKIKLDLDEFFILASGHFIKLGLEFDFTWSSKVEYVPFTILSYQQDQYGILAWLMEGSYKGEKGTVWVKIPITRTGDIFHIRQIEHSMPVNSSLSIELKSD
ncbi:MAG: hypothetical protein V4622_01505 [Bacteroidota bacterium]